LTLNGAYVDYAIAAVGSRWQTAGLTTGTVYGEKMEGHSGWRYVDYATRADSPFVNDGVLDIANYISNIGVTPDVVVFFLGYNDCGQGDPLDPDAAIDVMFANADLVHAAWAADSPTTDLLVCLMPEPNDDANAFTYDYPSGPSRADWETIRAQLNVRLAAKYGAACIGLHINGTTGYPAYPYYGAALHPSTLTGHQQLGCFLAQGLSAIYGV